MTHRAHTAHLTKHTHNTEPNLIFVVFEQQKPYFVTQSCVNVTHNICLMVLSHSYTSKNKSCYFDFHCWPNCYLQYEYLKRANFELSRELWICKINYRLNHHFFKWIFPFLWGELNLAYRNGILLGENRFVPEVSNENLKFFNYNIAFVLIIFYTIHSCSRNQMFQSESHWLNIFKVWCVWNIISKQCRRFIIDAVCRHCQFERQLMNIASGSTTREMCLPNANKDIWHLV